MPNTVKILTLDDDELVQRVIVAFLKRFLDKHKIASEIVTFSDPIECMFELSNHAEQYDLILLDVRLPKLTGDNLYNSLLHTNPDLVKRVVFITGYPDDLISRFPETSLNVLNKPFQYDGFCKEIAAVLKPK